MRRILRAAATLALAWVAACAEPGSDFFERVESEVHLRLTAAGGRIELVGIEERSRVEGELGGVPYAQLEVSLELEFLEDGRWLHTRPFQLFEGEPDPYSRAVRAGERVRIERSFGFRRTADGWITD